jgi:signal transduction histidine kinase
MKINIKKSLRVKLFAVTIFSLLVSIMLYFAGMFALDRYMENVYRSEEKTEARAKKQVESFATYVTNHGVKSSDSEGIKKWQEKHEDIYIVVYKNDRLVFDADWVIKKRGAYKYVVTNSKTGEIVILISDSDGIVRKIERSEVNSSETTNESVPYSSAETDYKFYPVLFKDGVFDVCIVDYSDDKVRNFGMASVFVACCVLFLIMIVCYFGSIIGRVRRLATEAGEIKGDNLSGRITVSGSDEIGILAKNVDNMRDTLIHQLGKEKEAWQANSDLVTAMAHDIRTPLTVMSGYLELLKNGEYSSQEELKEYVRISYDKAEQLRLLSDKMFRYFYVYSHDRESLTFERFEAGDFLEQTLGEYAVLLSESGYKCRLEALQGKAYMSVDVQGFKRIGDNIFANIRKYSDKAAPVEIICQLLDEKIRVTVRNRISPDRDKAESTRIGTLTCKKMAEAMGGSFEATEKNDIYECVLALPCEIEMSVKWKDG